MAVLGGLLGLGCVLHAEALSKANLKLRLRGMMLTFGTLITLAVVNIVFAVHTLLAH